MSSPDPLVEKSEQCMRDISELVMMAKERKGAKTNPTKKGKEPVPPKNQAVSKPSTDQPSPTKPAETVPSKNQTAWVLGNFLKHYIGKKIIPRFRQDQRANTEPVLSMVCRSLVFFAQNLDEILEEQFLSVVTPEQRLSTEDCERVLKKELNMLLPAMRGEGGGEGSPKRKLEDVGAKNPKKKKRKLEEENSAVVVEAPIVTDPTVAVDEAMVSDDSLMGLGMEDMEVEDWEGV